ncbi:MAG: hypothetical protein BMS9Abin25_1067 [Gammaproteobacteria bacterium]|nr:MAG: hypothetical protein BMS9Abin25_1067 [Gammaproteobacteria bacterium]
MSHYCGIDLHSNNHVVVIIDEEDRHVFEKRLSNDLSLTLKTLSPYRETLHGIAKVPRTGMLRKVPALIQMGDWCGSF